MVRDRTIELLIVSHSDSDHLGELEGIFADNRILSVVHTGCDRETDSYRDFIAALERERATVDVLPDAEVAPGRFLTLGPARVTFLAGWHEWDNSLSTGPLRPEERRNVISIVARLDYRGKSVLLTGDSIGRLRDSEDDTLCDHAERWMVQRHGARLRSDVLLASHHGGNNGSASCFLNAVRPRFVVFPAGNDHHHPTAAAARRVLAAGVPLNRIFRTDFGDDEGGFEWDHGRRPGCRDSAGDDDVEIRLPRAANRQVTVRYRSQRSSC